MSVVMAVPVFHAMRICASFGKNLAYIMDQSCIFKFFFGFVHQVSNFSAVQTKSIFVMLAFLMNFD